MGTKIHKKYKEALISNNGCECLIYPIGSDAYYVSCLATNRQMRGKGYAKALLSRITKFANKVNKQVHLCANPFDNRTLDVSSLVKMYEKAGFKMNGKSTIEWGHQKMVYVPTP